MKPDDNNCPNCERLFYGPNVFCPFCGCNVLDMDTVLAQLVLDEEEKRAPEKKKIDLVVAKKKNPAVAFFVAVPVVGVLILGSVLASSDGEPPSPTPTSANPNATSSAPQPTVESIAFSDVSELMETQEVAGQYCSDLQEAIEVPDFLPRPAAEIAAEVDNISSQSRASTYVERNRSWIRKNMVDEFRLSLREIVRPGVSQLIDQLGYDSDEFEVDSTQWLIGLTNQSVVICGLDDQLDNTEELVEQFQTGVDDVIELAN